MNNKTDQQRRRFIKNLALVTGGSYLLGPQSKLHLINNAFAADYTGLDDYKSLVCIFQPGGNDAINMLPPYAQTAYQSYERARQALAIPREQLLPISGGQYGFHPMMENVRDLYDSGALAIVADVGNLFRPTTLDDFKNRNGTPPDLFSHNLQAETWQTARPPHVGARLPGWGGLMADLLNSANANTGIFPSFSTAGGTNFWQSGHQTQQFSVSSGGIREFGILEGSNASSSSSRTQAWNRLLGLQQSHILKAQAAETISSARQRIAILQEKLNNVPEIATFSGSGNLGQQLRMVARLISAREELGMRRQFFFVTAGDGWDTHGTHISDHANLLTQLNDGLAYFYQTIEQLGFADSVTSFTASEFGRTLTSNGDGTDHAWGSQYMVMGGAVNGGAIHGEIPVMELGGSNDAVDEGGIPAGRFIPEYSVDQYGATLAKWMGITDSDLSQVFPNLDNFAVRDLGFMSG